MQKGMIFTLALLAVTMARAQLTIDSRGLLYLQDSAVLCIQGDLHSTADIAGAGTILLNGWSPQHVDINGHTLPNLRLDNTAGAVLDGDGRISNHLIFTNGKISLTSSSLYLQPAADITGYDEDRYVITDGSGLLVKGALAGSPVTFPVGSSDGRYFPLTLTQNGAVHDVGIRALPGILSNGNSGNPRLSAAINVSWEITDIDPGSDDLGIVAGWDAGAELPGFDRDHAGILRYETGKGWYAAGEKEDKAGSGPYTYSLDHLNGSGLISIASGLAPSAGAIKVFPNPASTGFYVQLPPQKTGAEYSLTLLDLSGRPIQSQLTSGDLYFKVGPLATGTYLLKIAQNGQEIATEKMLILRQ